MTPWRLLLVDDEPEVGETMSDLLESSRTSKSGNRPIRVTFEQSFDAALDLLRTRHFDILVLDIRNQSLDSTSNEAAAPIEAGIEVFENIRQRRFIPIVFYTALPDLAENISNPPFVQVVSKISKDPIRELENAIGRVIISDLPVLLEAVSKHVAEVERDFMIHFVEQNWRALMDRPSDLAYLLSRRLAISFEERAEGLATGLGQDVLSTSNDAIHPTRYYIQPANSSYRMGDLLKTPESTEEGSDESILYVVLTPSCDLVPRSGRTKADYVILSQCLTLDEFDAYRDWKEAGSDTDEKKVKEILKSRPRGQEDRYFYLPAAWNVPDRVIDFQRVASISVSSLASYEKIASLDSPFAEALSYRFNRYVGRVAYPDLDIEFVLNRLDRA